MSQVQISEKIALTECLLGEENFTN